MTTGPEQGQVTVLVAGVLVALIAMAGLVFDGGDILAAHRRADNEAAGAARAAAQAVSASDLLATGTVVLDPTRARAAALAYLARTGHAGVVDVNGNTVHVAVTFREPVQILGIVGVASATVHGEASALAVRGVTVQDDRPARGQVTSADRNAGGN
jgi:hypothetical protein